MSDVRLPSGSKVTVSLGGLTVGHLRFLVRIAESLGLDDSYPVSEEMAPLDDSITIGIAIESPDF